MTSSKNHNLLVVTDFFLPHWTGLSKSIAGLSFLATKTSHVSLVTVQHDPQLPEKEHINGVTVYRAPYIASVSRARIAPKLLLLLIRHIRTSDTVLVNMPCTVTFPAVLLARLMKKRVVLFHQGDLILPKGIGNRIIEVVFDMLTLPACALAHTISTYTDDYARFSRIVRPFYTKFVPLRLPLLSSDARPSSDIALRMQNLKKNHPVLIGFAGRFVMEKGFDVLLKAIPEIVKTNPGVHFVFAGETAMKYEQFFERNQDLWKSASDNITMLGLLDERGLAAFYNHLSWFIMPSRSDCFGLVQIEAMQKGVPVLVSDIPGARMPVTETGFGMLFQSENPGALAKTVLEAVQKTAVIMRNKQKALRYITDYSYEKNIRIFLGL